MDVGVHNPLVTIDALLEGSPGAAANQDLNLDFDLVYIQQLSIVGNERQNIPA